MWEVQSFSSLLWATMHQNTWDYTFASLQTINHMRTYREETLRTLLTLRLGKSTFIPVKKSGLTFFLPNFTLIFFSSFFFLRWKSSSHRTGKIGGAYGSFQPYDQSSVGLMTGCCTEPITFWLQQKGEYSLVSAIKSPPVKITLPPCTRLSNMIHQISFHGKIYLVSIHYHKLPNYNRFFFQFFQYNFPASRPILIMEGLK